MFPVSICSVDGNPHDGFPQKIQVLVSIWHSQRIIQGLQRRRAFGRSDVPEHDMAAKLKLCWNFSRFMCVHTRVDVSETFSADQLIQKNFRSVSALFITSKSLNSAKKENFQSQELALIQGWTALISSETALNSDYFKRIRMTIFGSFFIFSKFSEVPQIFSPICVKKLTTKI